MHRGLTPNTATKPSTKRQATAVRVGSVQTPPGKTCRHSLSRCLTTVMSLLLSFSVSTCMMVLGRPEAQTPCCDRPALVLLLEQFHQSAKQAPTATNKDVLLRKRRANEMSALKRPKKQATRSIRSSTDVASHVDRPRSCSVRIRRLPSTCLVVSQICRIESQCQAEKIFVALNVPGPRVRPTLPCSSRTGEKDHVK